MPASFTFRSIDVPNPVFDFVYISVNGVDAAGNVVGNYGNTVVGSDGDTDSDFRGFRAQSGSNDGTPFDPPLSTNTTVVGVTPGGEVFGDYVDNRNAQHGFTEQNGVFTKIDAFLATSTTLSGVNAGGVIFGSYVSAQTVHGFIDSNGSFMTIDVPGAASTDVDGVSAAGEIAGTITDQSSHVHGFVINNGVTTTFDPPGSTFTSVLGVTPSGEIVGNYDDGAGNSHGFVDNNGAIASVDVPGAVSTAISGFNDSGELAGYYVDGAGNIHGWLDNGGVLTLVDVPGATQTDILGVDDAGDIFGFYNDGANIQHGFVGAPGAATPAPGNANFLIDDTTTGATTRSAGTPYSGPVAGLAFQYENTTSDNLNVTAQVPNSFIHTGGGEDAIDVSHVGGTNVLDGSTNSNFLVGGTGAGSSDTFFVDDRHPGADIWSTVVNFHPGDAATVFGVTQNGFQTDWENGQGAGGYTGLTLHETAPGVPTASLTLAGYSTADLTNGHLSLSWGTEPDGTPYLYIHANLLDG